MKTVAAAVILRGDPPSHELLVCRRRADQPLPLKWEFAGGKVENGEEPAACLRRELREELDVEADIGPELCRFAYQYPGLEAVLLVFFKVTEFRGDPRNMVFSEIRWVCRDRLSEFDFLDADRELVDRVSRGELI